MDPNPKPQSRCAFYSDVWQACLLTDEANYQTETAFFVRFARVGMGFPEVTSLLIFLGDEPHVGHKSTV